MKFSVVTLQDRTRLICRECGEVDELYCKTIWKLLHDIAQIEEEKYPNGKGWQYFAEFVWDCCNPSIPYEDIEKKYDLLKLKKENSV